MREQIFLLFYLSLMMMIGWANAAVYHVAQRHPEASDENPGTIKKPWKTISKAADILQPGDTVIVHAGVYREWVEPKNSGRPDAPITYQGAKGEKVILTGADIVMNWERDKGEKPVWKKAPWPFRFIVSHDAQGHPIEHHPGDEFHKLIGRAEQVIVDDKLLEQVLDREEMRPGTFCADTQNQVLYVWLADGGDPNRHKVEVSTRGWVFGINPWLRPKGVNDIRVRGFTIRYAANHAQRGALFVVGDRWTIEDVIVEWTNGNGISFGGAGSVMRHVISQYNGQMGFGGSGAGIQVENCRLLYNNRKGYSQGWEAGGCKIVLSTEAIIKRVTAIGNRGPGIWFDIDNRNCKVAECFCKDNEGPGIMVEISKEFVIANNLCLGNGGTSFEGWSNGGILLAESPNCVVEHNICVGNRTGIALREQGPRTFAGIGGEQVSYYCHDELIRHNICAYNREYQFGLWSDNVFFGPHPSPEVGSRGIPLNPDALNICLDNNLYFPEEGQGLILWGVPWREKHNKYANLASFVREHGQDKHSVVADPKFVNPTKGDFRLKSDSPALKLGAGLQVAPIREK